MRTAADGACERANLLLCLLVWAGLVAAVRLAVPDFPWWGYLLLVPAARVASGYLVERLLSGFVNTVVPRLFR